MNTLNLLNLNNGDSNVENTLNLLDLNNDVLELILKNLDVRSLIKTTEVCTRFNDLISDSSKLMKNIRLKVVKCKNEPFFWRTRNVVDSVRKYKNIYVESLSSAYPLEEDEIKRFLVKILHKFGPNIRDLEIKGLKFESNFEFQELMTSFENIESCCLTNVDVNDNDNTINEETPLKFTKLRKLEVIECNFMCNQIFKNCDKLTKLYIKPVMTLNLNYNPLYFEHIEELVFKQQKLKQLMLHSVPNGFMFKNDRSKQVKFQLILFKSWNSLFVNRRAAMNFFGTQHKLSKVVFFIDNVEYQEKDELVEMYQEILVPIKKSPHLKFSRIVLTTNLV
ncbi:unnamed protein product [Diamesa tonsa]